MHLFVTIFRVIKGLSYGWKRWGGFFLGGRLSFIFFRLSNTGPMLFQFKANNYTFLSRDLSMFFFSLKSRFDNRNSKVILDYFWNSLIEPSNCSGHILNHLRISCSNVSEWDAYRNLRKEGIDIKISFNVARWSGMKMFLQWYLLGVKLILSHTQIGLL